MLAQAYSVSSLFIGGETRRKFSKSLDNIICHRKARLCYLLTPDRLLFANSVGVFLIEPVDGPSDNWMPRYRKIRAAAQDRKLDSYAKLVSACGRGMKFTQVRLEWYL